MYLSVKVQSLYFDEIGRMIGKRSFMINFETEAITKEAMMLLMNFHYYKNRPKVPLEIVHTSDGSWKWSVTCVS